MEIRLSHPWRFIEEKIDPIPEIDVKFIHPDKLSGNRLADDDAKVIPVKDSSPEKFKSPIDKIPKLKSIVEILLFGF